MSTPSADGDDAPEDLEETLEKRAREVIEDEEFVTFEEHNDERED